MQTPCLARDMPHFGDFQPFCLIWPTLGQCLPKIAVSGFQTPQSGPKMANQGVNPVLNRCSKPKKNLERCTLFVHLYLFLAHLDHVWPFWDVSSCPQNGVEVKILGKL